MALHLATPVKLLLRSRVLYLDVTSSCKSPLNTGVQRVVRGLYRELSARMEVTPLLWSDGWDTYCRLGDKQYQYLATPFHNYRRPSDRPEILSAPSYWSRTLRHWGHRARRINLKNLATAKDILLVPEIFQDNRTKALATVNRWFPGKRVAIFHDAVPLRLSEITKSAEQQTFPEYVCALASFDKVICPSKETASDLRFYWSKFGVNGGETSVQMWPIGFEQPRAARSSREPSHRILCVSSFHQRKNHLCLLEAAELLWNEGLDFELILVGRTTAHGGPAVNRMLNQLTGKGRPVKWLQHVDDESLHREYRDCDFTVYPSLREGFGLPILESLWYGRPCVCGDNGALGEVSSGGGCLAVRQEQAVALANGMRQLLQDKPSYEKLCVEARQRTFRSWDNYMHDLLRELDLGGETRSRLAPEPLTTLTV